MTHLTTLDLSKCRSITSLPDLESLTDLTTVTLYECTNLTDLSGLTQLKKLTKLNLVACNRLEKLPALNTLPTLSIVNLSECIALQDVDFSGCSNLTTVGLSKCIWLKQVNLSHCKKLTTLDLTACDGLTGVILRGCEKLSILSLSCRDHLQKLDVSGCKSLASLSLDTCCQLTTLTGLCDLKQLTRIALVHCRSLTQLDGLDQLARVSKLELEDCSSLSRIPSLKNLLQLTELLISDCRSLEALDGLENLPQLSRLTIADCGKLAMIADFHHLPQLTSLKLTNCRSLIHLSGLENLTRLTDLNLSGSNLQTIPDSIREIKSLRMLSLQNLKLKDLPSWLPEIAEEFSLNNHDWHSGRDKAIVNLCDTTVEGVDMSIFGQPYEMDVKWFDERKKGRTQRLDEIKVIFLGDGEAGKSYTISRLMNNGGAPVDYEGVRTPGIAIKNHPCKFDNREFKVNYWDFGGQEIMHAMHRVFLTNRTMYVVLVSVEDDDYQERAVYWLRNLKSFAPNAPILLAFNKIDMCPRLFLDENALRAANSNLKQIISMSALEFDQEKFDSEFRSVLLQEIVNTGMLDVQWPKSWIELKSRMETIQNPHIPFREYTKICKECQVEDVQIELLHWFNDLGVSFCFRNNYKLKNQIILQPKWITNGLYIILFNQCRGVVGGMVPHESIHDLLENAPNDTTIQCTDRNAEYEIPRDAEYVLGIMRQFGLSLPIGEDREFIPMLCQPHPPLDLASYAVDEKVLEFHMDFEYLPINVLHRLMVERYSEVNPSNVWRSGVQFKQPGTRLGAVVSVDRNTLKYFISCSDSQHAPHTYLTVLKGHVDQIWQQMGLHPPREKIVYKRNGKLGIFDYEELRQNFKNGTRNIYSAIWNQNVSIADILGLLSSNFTTGEMKLHHAPMSRSTDPTELLNAILRSCQTIQDEPTYCLKPGTNSNDMENVRNRRVRDDLGKESKIRDLPLSLPDGGGQSHDGAGQRQEPE